jgi:hypothetical protein
MAALPYLPSVDQTLFASNRQQFQLEEIADFAVFQASAVRAFDATLAAAQDVQKEFCSLAVVLNSAAKSPLLGMSKETLLQRLIIETLSHQSSPRLFHISLGQQFNRIFLKRRKVQ